MMSLKREDPNILTVSILRETIFSSLMLAKLLCIRVNDKSFVARPFVQFKLDRFNLIVM